MFDLEKFSWENSHRCESPQGFNHNLHSWSTSDWFTAVLGELGEAANVAKKLNRERDGVPGNRESPQELQQALRRELADAFIYLDLLAQSVGCKFHEVVPEVFDSKSQEICYPGGPLKQLCGERPAKAKWGFPDRVMPPSAVLKAEQRRVHDEGGHTLLGAFGCAEAEVCATSVLGWLVRHGNRWDVPLPDDLTDICDEDMLHHYHSGRDCRWFDFEKECTGYSPGIGRVVTPVFLWIVLRLPPVAVGCLGQFMGAGELDVPYVENSELGDMQYMVNVSMPGVAVVDSTIPGTAVQDTDGAQCDHPYHRNSALLFLCPECGEEI